MLSSELSNADNAISNETSRTILPVSLEIIKNLPTLSDISKVEIQYDKDIVTGGPVMSCNWKKTEELNGGQIRMSFGDHVAYVGGRLPSYSYKNGLLLSSVNGNLIDYENL